MPAYEKPPARRADVYLPAHFPFIPLFSLGIFAGYRSCPAEMPPFPAAPFHCVSVRRREGGSRRKLRRRCPTVFRRDASFSSVIRRGDEAKELYISADAYPDGAGRDAVRLIKSLDLDRLFDTSKSRIKRG